MESREDKDLKRFTKKVFLEADKEKVSFDFTSNVMSQIKNIQNEKTVYKPLIPKVVWAVILFALLFWFGYLFVNHFDGDSEWIPSIDLSFIFSNFQISKSTSYTIVLFAFMVCLQVPLLKHYFNKRLKA